MVTLNSDDPPMFGANLLDEYILAQERYGFSLDQMRELAANAVEASFLPPPRNCNSSRASSNTAELVPAVQWSFLSTFFPLTLQRTAQWKTELRKTPSNHRQTLWHINCSHVRRQKSHDFDTGS